jgi:hypothetical protein
MFIKYYTNRGGAKDAILADDLIVLIRLLIFVISNKCITKKVFHK